MTHPHIITHFIILQIMTVTSSLAITYCYHRLCGNSRLDTTTLTLKDDTYLSLLGATCTLNYAKLPYIYCVCEPQDYNPCGVVENHSTLGGTRHRQRVFYV